MSDQVTVQDTASSADRAQAVLNVELMMDHYRVGGELRSPGVPRRLVDILNSADLPFIVVHDAALDDPLIDDDEPRRFNLVQVHLDTLLFGIPRAGTQVQPDPFEIIEKNPVRTTIAMRGFQIVGNVYFTQGLDPTSSQLLGSKYFVPVTDACVTSAVRPDCVWQEQVVVVNMARALLFAPH
ncbi:MAG TPA: hypothetical protein VMR52_10550 [Dehalococcoidia bacterium]|nr:hypothetical protein [Dehalococcoidia bacterium]